MKISTDYIVRKICGDTLLMPVGDKNREYDGIFTLTETGAVILDAIENGANVQQAAEKLTQEFEISAETALQDTTDFCEELFRLGILIE